VEENLSVKLFVGGLSWQTEEDHLREYFSQFGAIDNVQIMKDPFTLRSRGFGFITFSSASSMDRVLALPSHILDGKKIDPKPATPKSKSREAKTRKIFVGGVSQETSSEEVKKYFSQYGPVEDAVMLMDQMTKRHRGFGFVTFEAEETVEIVCELHYHTIKNKKVEVKKAQPKEAVMSASAASLLGKRLVMLPPSSTASSSPASGLVNIPLLQQPLMGLGQIGKILPSSSSVHSLRYSPYQTLSSSSPSLGSLQQLQSLQPLQAYSQPLQLQSPVCSSAAPASNAHAQYSAAPSLDLSALTGLDWSQFGLIPLQ